MLPVPRGWRLCELRMTDGPALPEDEIERALDAPVDAPSIPTLAAGKRKAAIAIDDITRPTNTAPLLRLLIDRLTQAGLSHDDVTIIVATGAHRRATPRDLELKVGRDLLGRVRVISHDPGGDLCATGVALGGVPVRINREFAAADLRMGIGAVMPHPFAGFSGGGKIVVPGLADLDVLARTHKFALMGFTSGSGNLDNRFRGEMEQAVREIGLHWTVNIVVNSRRETAVVAAGDLVTAHRSAAAAAQRLGATAAPVGPLDALLLNAYPKDGELLQIESALVTLRNGMLPWLAPSAPVILMGACPEGLGHHGLFAPGGRLSRVPSPKTFLAARKLWVFAPGVTEAEVRSVFAEQYPWHATPESLITALGQEVPADARVGWVRCGPLQIAGADSAAERTSGNRGVERSQA
jgi:nickel-dependent lactate racemase